MPTLGWVYEDAVDAYYGAKSRQPDRGPPVPRLYFCPFCHFSDRTLRTLEDHVHSSHSVSRPALLLGGKECSSDATVRKEMHATVINCRRIEIEVDGGLPETITAPELAERFLALKQGSILLQLTNHDASSRVTVKSSYRLNFRIPNHTSLEDIDSAFTEHFIKTPLTMTGVAVFTRDERCVGDGQEYAGALASYCIGVLLREGSTTDKLTMPIAESRTRFGEALEILSAFDRPVAKFLTKLMRFLFNDYRHSDNAPPSEQLDRTIATLTGQTLGFKTATYLSPERRLLVPLCPIDHATSRILELGSRLWELNRWSKSLSHQCRMLADLEIYEPDDKVKVFALWAANAYRLDAVEEAVEPLSVISASLPFSEWAEDCLIKIENGQQR